MFTIVNQIQQYKLSLFTFYFNPNKLMCENFKGFKTFGLTMKYHKNCRSRPYQDWYHVVEEPFQVLSSSMV